MNWLIDAFGLTEKARWVEGGRLVHGELELEGQIIMVPNPTPDYLSPKSIREGYPPAQAMFEVPYVLNGVMVYVRDIASHFARAKQAGATILSGIEEGFPGKRYRAEDPEGNRWFFLEMSAA